MILLDTNVASELMRPKPSHGVAVWLDRTSIDELYLSSISWLELKFGVELLPAGKRRTLLTGEVEKLRRLFDGRILSFDLRAAEETARFSAARRASGKGVEWRDAQIAGVALCHSAKLATRNVRDFDAIGLDLINPWEAA
ncbi:MAG TPA: type II toxin-antitoxin system VapC family toxin [Rhodoblastus sp.]|nr:type II toxin-antitoxin system VapC family toxin [Rhodoblastus sp.]